jgi:NAD(P)H-hydrate epimerase
VIKRYLEKATAVILGPGLGLHKETFKAVGEILKLAEKTKTPTLLDADGLKAFAKNKRRLLTPTVLTPHFGEYSLLGGKNESKNIGKMMETVRKIALKFDAVILLKSHVDIISNGFRVKSNFTGNPGMTVGGTGDVLSGIVGAFLAKGIDPFEAAVAGAFINGAAGDFVKSKMGFHMTATDLIEHIPLIMENPMIHLKIKESINS